jgi:hypothetical protein
MISRPTFLINGLNWRDIGIGKENSGIVGAGTEKKRKTPSSFGGLSRG